MNYPAAELRGIKPNEIKKNEIAMLPYKGRLWGSVRNIITQLNVLDISTPVNAAFTHVTTIKHTILTHVITGKALFYNKKASFIPLDKKNDFDIYQDSFIQDKNSVLIEDDNNVEVSTRNVFTRRLLI